MQKTNTNDIDLGTPLKLCEALEMSQLVISAYLDAWVRQNCQLAFSRATTTTFPRSSGMGAVPSTSQWGAGLQILEGSLSPSTRRTAAAHSRPGRLAPSHRGKRHLILSALDTRLGCRAPRGPTLNMCCCTDML